MLDKIGTDLSRAGRWRLDHDDGRICASACGDHLTVVSVRDKELSCVRGPGIARDDSSATSSQKLQPGWRTGREFGVLPGILGCGQQALGIVFVCFRRDELADSGEEAPCCLLGPILRQACAAERIGGARMARKFLAEFEGRDRQETRRRPDFEARKPGVADGDVAAVRRPPLAAAAVLRARKRRCGRARPVIGRIGSTG